MTQQTALFYALKAMHTVARANGRDWKYKLSCAWATGRYWELKGIASNNAPECGLLQALRNSPRYGPGSDFWRTVKATPEALQWEDEDGAQVLGMTSY